jgi:hypothetical protein
MSSSDPSPRYRFYLLACWAEWGPNPDDPPRWRFSLQDPRTGERRGFADLEALVATVRHALEEGGMQQDGEEGLTTLSEDSE